MRRWDFLKGMGAGAVLASCPGVRSLRLVIETSVGRPVVRQFAAFRGGRA